jgi:Cft2 family RNA processing exonuclease
MQVRFDRGVHLPDLDLWLDPQVRQAIAFVSHAHSDHTGSHDHVLATPATAAIMRRRTPGRTRFRPLQYREPYRLGDGALTLYPAGHILGSAQLLVERYGCRLLYSGDFKLRAGRSSEPAEVPAADIVVMESTFGRPQYRFPPAPDVAARIRDFCDRAMANGEVAVLFCYSLGKGQEVLAWLSPLEGQLWLHPAHAEMADLYRSLGVALPRFRIFQPGSRLQSGVLLCAPGARDAPWLHRIPRRRTAYISGWAVAPRSRFLMGTDDCFALSDHADYDDLLEYARRTGAGRIYTVHGFASDFARDLRARGFDAHSLSDPEVQLCLF